MDNINYALRILLIVIGIIFIVLGVIGFGIEFHSFRMRQKTALCLMIGGIVTVFATLILSHLL